MIEDQWREILSVMAILRQLTQVLLLNRLR